MCEECVGTAARTDEELRALDAQWVQGLGSEACISAGLRIHTS